MALAISTNFAINANTALNAMNKSQSLMGKSISRISTGNRAANPADDPLSYFSGNKIKGDTDGYQALYNGIQDGAARINVADTALSSIIDVLTEMKSKAIAYESLNSTDQGGDAGTAISNAYNQLYSSLSSFTGATYKGVSVWDSSGLSFTTTLGGTGSGGGDTTTTYTWDSTVNVAVGSGQVKAATISAVDATKGVSGSFTVTHDGSSANDKSFTITDGKVLDGTTEVGTATYANKKLTITPNGSGTLYTANGNSATPFDISFTEKTGSSGGGSAVSISADTKITNKSITTSTIQTWTVTSNYKSVEKDSSDGTKLKGFVDKNDNEYVITESSGTYSVYKKGDQTDPTKKMGEVVFTTGKATFSTATAGGSSPGGLTAGDIATYTETNAYTVADDGKFTNIEMTNITSNNLAGNFKYDGHSFTIEKDGSIKDGSTKVDGATATVSGTAGNEKLSITFSKAYEAAGSGSGGSGNFTVSDIGQPDVSGAQTISSSGVQGVIDTISKQRTALGGSLAAMDSISSYLSSMVTANDAAYTAVTEANIAKEMTSYVKNNVYSQAAQAMISQANQSLAQVLNLLQ